MSYQKCPVCNGSGVVTPLFDWNYNVCPTCKGARIIDEYSGLPPETLDPKTNSATTYIPQEEIKIKT